jgi:hypothetical protein
MESNSGMKLTIGAGVFGAGTALLTLVVSGASATSSVVTGPIGLGIAGVVGCAGCSVSIVAVVVAVTAAYLAIQDTEE